MIFDKGDIIWLDFDPALGHEQQGHRPGIVISNKFTNRLTNTHVVMPITSNMKSFPTHIPLDDRTRTVGCICTEHAKSLDLHARKVKKIEDCPADILEDAIETYKERFL